MKYLVGNLLDAATGNEKDHFIGVLYQVGLYDNENDKTPNTFMLNMLSGEHTPRLIKAMRKAGIDVEPHHKHLKSLEDSGNYTAIYYFIALLIVTADGYFPPFYNALQAEPSIMEEYLHQVILDFEDCL